jgi:sulfonate transport system permease protein
MTWYVSTDKVADRIGRPRRAPRVALHLDRWERRLVPLLLPAAVLVLWQVATMRGWMSVQTLPSPDLVAATFVELVKGGDIAANLTISARRIAEGFAIGAAAGLAFGIWLGVSDRAQAYLGPLFRALAAVPSLGWLPIFILIFGIEEPLKLIIIAKAVFVPIVINTSQGIRNIPASYVEAARVLRLKRWSRFVKLIVPASLPTIFSGVRLGLSHAFIALIVVEMLAATEGIGYMMTWGRTLFQTDIVIVGMIVVGVTGFLLDRALRRLETSLRRWAPA